jgi:transcriptional regulator with XRE-family HTH domain
MSTSSSSPTARRWELAARLRDLRLAAGRTVEEVAVELMCSPAKISRLETAGRGIQPRDVRDLCRFYGVPDRVQVDLLRLAADAKKPGWWQDFRTLPEQAVMFVGLETAAAEVRIHEALRVPGLLQTPDYTRGLLRGVRPPGEFSEAAIEEWVAVRLRRQERLRQGDLRLDVVVDEAVLARIVGSRSVMLAQIERLLAASEMPTVTLRVVPFARGAYPGVDGSFQWMTFTGSQVGDLVVVEGLMGIFLLDKDVDARRYLEVHDYICEHFALSPQETTGWLHAYRERLATALESPG